MKHSLFFAVIFFVFAANGQEPETLERNFQKGGYIAGFYGSGGFSNGPAYRNPRWSVSPWAGYFIGTNLATGLRMSYGWDVYELKSAAGTTGIPNHRYNSLAPEVFLRYYVHHIKIKPFVQVGAGYNFQWGEVDNTPGRVKASNIIGSVEGGIRFPVGKRFSIDAAYNWRAFSKSDLNDSNEKGRLRLGFSFRL